jgi:hypothetical protein
MAGIMSLELPSTFIRYRIVQRSTASDLLKWTRLVKAS